MLPTTAGDLRRAGLASALRVVHGTDGELTRAGLARALGCTRATAAALVSDLDRLGLVTEEGSTPTGRRGRPSPRLRPAAGGPVVVTLEIAVDDARVATVGLGGDLQEVETASLEQRDADHVLDVARSLLTRRLDRVGARCAGIGVAMYGLVERATGTVASAPNLGWREDVPVLLRLEPPAGLLVEIDNVAHLWALADARRGPAARSGTVLFLQAGIGLGGALVLDGHPLRGRSGFAGEFGHLPLGRLGLPCRCGSRGCWETEVDQRALARAARRPPGPSTADSAAAVLADATRGDATARAAVHQVAAALGRGIGALVTAHDPDLVVLAGFATDVLTAAAEIVIESAREAVLGAHRPDLPPIEPTRFRTDGGLVGAAESLFGRLLEDPAALAAHAGGRR